MQIKSRWSGAVIYEDDSADIRTCILAAFKNGANLSGAYLSGAYLSGANLSRADLSGAYLSGANLSGAYLSGAYLSGANLSRADLSRAYLSRANLSRANLSRAHLSGANLSRADLSRADLSRAIGLHPWRTDDIRMMLDQPGAIRAYKLVNERGEGPFNGGIKYEIGATVAVSDANTDETEQCAAGISLATLPWCAREWGEGYRILIAEFTAKDIAAIPWGTDGKFRVHRCKIVGEKDLSEVGLIPEGECA